MRKGLIILGDLKDEDLIWLSRAGELREIPASEAIITAGQEVKDLFFITNGHFSALPSSHALQASMQTC